MDNSPAHEPLELGIVTVSFGSGGVLPSFLDSVQIATTHPHQLVIADNKPTDDENVAGIAAAYGADYVPLEDNPGYGGAINRAVRLLEPTIRWVLITNPDVVLGPGSIDALVEATNEDSSVGSVGPAILTAEGELYPSARRVPSLRMGVGHALFANLWPRNRWSRAYRNDWDESARDAGWLSGACVLVRRDALSMLGGFDESYFMYFEDVDLGARLGKAGFRNIYRPNARVVHSGAHSTAETSERMLHEHHKSASQFLSRKYAGPLLWPVRVALRLGLSARASIEGRRLRDRS
ncbi:glycosyltransferase family 2 protein [Salinibacterium hongtaonis]|uniref:glycosyltransferase family 2 protein n=1 Tax=Homoserinimonas hongtaonis TaxID=2079791 RepID=UPI000D3D4C0A|nr:glycosyltransferase family 2 protein [Salinibacterium hongtaonis]AWB88633.1 dTDP-Rha--alpha-D-GlcNAc-pyrophosphate polyprenol alpha-3-L-rhamnosyltransferase [Salinibacterium hongtaonis]